jgi:TM2 domain-containing membrane protein YozV
VTETRSSTTKPQPIQLRVLAPLAYLIGLVGGLAQATTERGNHDLFHSLGLTVAAGAVVGTVVLLVMVLAQRMPNQGVATIITFLVSGIGIAVDTSHDGTMGFWVGAIVVLGLILAFALDSHLGNKHSRPAKQPQ